MKNYWIQPDGQEVLVPLKAPWFNHSETARIILSKKGVEMSPIEAKDELIKIGWIRVSDEGTFEMSDFDRCRSNLTSFLEVHKEEIPERIELDDLQGETRIVCTEDV